MRLKMPALFLISVTVSGCEFWPLMKSPPVLTPITPANCVTTDAGALPPVAKPRVSLGVGESSRGL